MKKLTKKRSRRGAAKRVPVDTSKFDVGHDFKPFIIKPIPTSNKKPLIGNILDKCVYYGILGKRKIS